MSINFEALISKKKGNPTTAYSVERQYINSKGYHDKFKQLPVNERVSESLYKQTGRLLEYIDSLEVGKQVQERMLAINGRTGEFIVDNFNREGYEYKTSFNDNEYEKIKSCPDSIIIVHNHSTNSRPSGQDLLTYLYNDKIKLSIIACHDGNLYAICYVNPIFENVYNDWLNIFKTRTNDIDEAKRLAMTETTMINDELVEGKKLFRIKKL